MRTSSTASWKLGALVVRPNLVGKSLTNVCWSGKLLPWKQLQANIATSWNCNKLTSPFFRRSVHSNDRWPWEMCSTSEWPERKTVKSTEGLVREAEMESSFQLPLGFTSFVPLAYPPSQSRFIFSEFCGVTLTWEELMASLSTNELNNFSREICGNLCCHYIALTCAAHERPHF